MAANITPEAIAKAPTRFPNLETQVALTLSAAVSPVRTSPTPARARELPASAAVYGKSTPELLARFDPDTSSWRTSQHCFIEGLETFSETFPRSGMMRNGTVFQLPPLVRLTAETASGLWPSPQTSEAKSDTLNTNNRLEKGKQVMLCHAVRMWPTPTSRDWKDGSAQSCTNVPANALLGRVVHQWPTPGGIRPNDTDQISGRLANEIGGSLNPTWVEWLMGFPLGWTDLKASATPSFRRSRKS
jgi:hypothetical protein